MNVNDKKNNIISFYFGLFSKAELCFRSELIITLFRNVLYGFFNGNRNFYSNNINMQEKTRKKTD